MTTTTAREQQFGVIVVVVVLVIVIRQQGTCVCQQPILSLSTIGHSARPSQIHLQPRRRQLSGVCFISMTFLVAARPGHLQAAGKQTDQPPANGRRSIDYNANRRATGLGWARPGGT